MNSGWGNSYEIILRWMPLVLTDDKSTLVQVMAWRRQATSHYLRQCRPRSMSPNGVTRPQWVYCLSFWLIHVRFGTRIAQDVKTYPTIPLLIFREISTFVFQRYFRIGNFDSVLCPHDGNVKDDPPLEFLLHPHRYLTWWHLPMACLTHWPLGEKK